MRPTSKGEGGRSPLSFSKIDKMYPDFGKKLPFLCASMGSILIWNAVLRVYWRRNTKIFPVLFSAPVTFSLTFYPNFHPSILVFANFSIYRKLIHDNISLVFWKPRIFCLALFLMRYQIVCIYKYLHWKLWVVLFWRR